jgi:hypothetical protein
MPTDKFGQTMPETEEDYKQQISDLKMKWYELRMQNRPPAEADALRDQAASLESWWNNFKLQARR